MLRRFNQALLGSVAAAGITSISLTEQEQNHAIFTKHGELLSARNFQDELLKQISVDCKKHEHLNIYKIYDTQAHRVLLTSIHKKCELLSKNRFVGRNGSHSRMIQGPKGVGKTTVLESYTKLCSIYHPNVIPIYISLDDLNSKESEMDERTIMECVLDKLTSDHGIKADTPLTKEYMGHRIVRALEAADKYILLIVDELEEVYRTSDVCPHRRNRLHMLGDLNWLGNQKSGRFAVYLCGSSSSCPLLVTCHASEEEFPLLSDAPHLNGTKYNTLRLPISPFTDLNAIKNIVNGYLDINDLSSHSNAFTNSISPVNREGLVRLIAFGVGAIPRSVDALCVKLEEGDSEIFSTLRPGAHLSGVRWYHDTSMPLYRKIIDRLREKNARMLEILTSDPNDKDRKGIVDLDLVRTVMWEKEFVPLTYEDIFRIWDRLCEEDEMFQAYHHDAEKLQFSILELCDKGQLTYTGIQGGMPVGLFPICPAQVFIDVEPSTYIQRFANTYDIHISKLFNRVCFF